MNIASKIIAASVLALSFAAPALAQEMNTLNERNVYLFTADGRMVKMSASDATHAMIMDHFKPMKAGMMLYVSGGKVYYAEDTKMANGEMMSHAVFGKDLGAGSQR
jgi:hypothetical protein